MKTETSIVCVVIWCKNTPEITFAVLKGDGEAEAKTYLSSLKTCSLALLPSIKLNRMIFWPGCIEFPSSLIPCMFQTESHFSATLFSAGLLKNSCCAAIRSCYRCSLCNYNLYISIYFAIPLKQVGKSNSRHTHFPQSTLDAQERYPQWKGKNWNPIWTHERYQNFSFPCLLIFNIQDSLSSSCDWTKFCLPCENCDGDYNLPSKTMKWLETQSVPAPFFLLLFVPISPILVRDRDNSGFHQQLQPDWILRKSSRYIWTAKIIFALGSWKRHLRIHQILDWQ